MRNALIAVTRSIAQAYDRWRTRAAERRPMLVEISVLRERLEGLREQNELLRARIRRLPSRQRPQYRPHERLAILAHAARHGLSVAKTSKAFVVSEPSISNWKRSAADEKSHVVEGKPPVNKLPELVAETARRVKREWPAWGTRRIAGILARLGLAVSRTTVQTFLRRAPSPKKPAAAARSAHTGHRRLVAKHPGHLWFIDFTRVGGFFRSVFVGAVIDGYSRKVLAVRVAPQQPPASMAVRLIRDAIAEMGPPTWVVSDHGTQLTADEFCRSIHRRGIRHRYGAIHRHGSLALIERWWKSMKSEFANGLCLYRPLPRIEAHLQAYARWFNTERPHQGLGQRTPDEVHFGRSTRAKAVPLRSVVAVRFIADEHALPVLRLRPAA